LGIGASYFIGWWIKDSNPKYNDEREEVGCRLVKLYGGLLIYTNNPIRIFNRHEFCLQY